MKELAQALQAAIERERKAMPPVRQYQETLIAAARAFMEPRTFAVGDLVAVKSEALNVYRYPRTGYPAVVVSLYPDGAKATPRREEFNCFNDPAWKDLEIGFLDADGDFLTALVDSRRFRHWDED